jgi:4-diphosphocytidyl-2-C-methyl-D-erythritol kinase
MLLRKKIPAGAGLGGGSADAAAAMHAVRRLLELEITDEEILSVALSIGSDVPFCFSGGSAWMRGRGELLEPVSLAPDLPLLVVIPPFRLSTPKVFAAWDSLGINKSSRKIPAPDPISMVIPELFNDLELAAELVEPRLSDFRVQVEKISEMPAVLAGSGSAYIVPLSRQDAWRLDEIADELRRNLRVPVATARTADRGVRLSRV